MGPEILICVRRTIDWRDPSLIDAEFAPKARRWNETFDVPYHVFRQRLKGIAEENLARIEGVRTCDPADAPPGALLVPVDDDDWFAPDLAAHLRAAYDPAARGYRWPPFVLEARPWGRRAKHERFSCMSNNHALHFEWRDAVSGHGAATRRFDAQPDLVRVLDRRLSIQNRNLSSQTVLGWRKPDITRGSLLRRHRRYRKLYARAVLPDELAWAAPCVEAMAALMSEL